MVRGFPLTKESTFYRYVSSFTFDLKFPGRTTGKKGREEVEIFMSSFSFINLRFYTGYRLR